MSQKDINDRKEKKKIKVISVVKVNEPNKVINPIILKRQIASSVIKYQENNSFKIKNFKDQKNNSNQLYEISKQINNHYGPQKFFNQKSNLTKTSIKQKKRTNIGENTLKQRQNHQMSNLTIQNSYNNMRDSNNQYFNKQQFSTNNNEYISKNQIPNKNIKTNQLLQQRRIPQLNKINSPQLQKQYNQLKQKYQKIINQKALFQQQIQKQKQQHKNEITELNQKIKKLQDQLQQLQKQHKNIQKQNQKNLDEYQFLYKQYHILRQQHMLQSSQLVQYKEIQIKKNLNNMIEKSTNKKVNQYKLIFKYNQNLPLNFHQFVDNKYNLLLLVKLQNGVLIGGFSQSEFSQTKHNTYGGFLFSLTINNLYPVKQGKYCMVYDSSFLIFGNSQIRIRTGQLKVLSNFGNGQGCFQSGNHSISQFFHGVIRSKQKIQKQYNQREINIIGFQIYFVKFSQQQNY